MARNFESASTEYLSYSGAPFGSPATLPITFSCHFNADDANGQEALMWYGDSTSANEYIALMIGDATASSFGSGARVGAITRSGGSNHKAFATADLTANVWNVATAVWAGDADRRVFLNGGSKGVNTTSFAQSGTYDTFALCAQRDSSPNWEFDGSAAEFAVWDVALTDAEALMLGLKVSPLFVRPQSLVFYSPVHGTLSPEKDLVGGLSMSVAATPLQSAHPRIFLPSSKILTFAPASGPAPTFSVVPSVQDNDEDSYTLIATPDAPATLYSVAVIRGETAPTATQIKAGNGTGDVAAQAAANKAITGVDTLVLGGSLDLPDYDIHSVLSNGSGDSAVATLSQQSLDAPAGKQRISVAILDVSAVTNANPPEVTTDEPHGMSTGQLIQPSGGDMTQFDATHANYAGNVSSDPATYIAGDEELFFQITVTGADTFTLDGLDSSAWDTYSGGAACPLGFSHFRGASPAMADGDVWELDVLTISGGYPITPYPDGTLTYDAGSDDAQQRIAHRVYDASAGTWTAEVTIFFNNNAPSLVLAFDNPVRFLQNVAYSLTPILGGYIDDDDGDTLVLTSLSNAPAGIDVNSGNNSIEGTTVASPTTDTAVLRVTDEALEFTDFNINYEVVETAQMPDVDDNAEATAVTAIEGAGLTSPTVVLVNAPGVTLGNVSAQVPDAGTYHDVDEETIIYISAEVTTGVNRCALRIGLGL